MTTRPDDRRSFVRGLFACLLAPLVVGVLGYIVLELML